MTLSPELAQWLNQGKAAEAAEQARLKELEEEEKQIKLSSAKVTPFQFIESIQTKNYLLSDSNVRHYVPHIVNLGLSQFVENITFCLTATQLQSKFAGLHVEFANQLHYDYLYNTVRKGKQYSKWAKVEQYDHLELVQETYKVNRDKAIEILNRLSDDDLKRLVEWDRTKLGGISKTKYK